MSFFEWVQARWWMWKTGANPASVLFLNNEETDRMERLAEKMGVPPVEIVSHAMKLLETVLGHQFKDFSIATVNDRGEEVEIDINGMEPGAKDAAES